LTTDEHICVSTDDDEIIKVVEEYGLDVPFKRPNHLSTDTATTNDVLLHAVYFYEANGKKYDTIVLLQPTSPLRTVKQIKEAIALYHDDLDMVVSVRKSHSVSVLCEESEEGFLEFCFNKNGLRRQDPPTYYEYNGAIYIINIEQIKKLSLIGLTKKNKYVMDEKSSIDIDSQIDWILAESI